MLDHQLLADADAKSRAGRHSSAGTFGLNPAFLWVWIGQSRVTSDAADIARASNGTYYSCVYAGDSAKIRTFVNGGRAGGAICFRRNIKPYLGGLR
jgi:hypothetical protein